MRLTLTLGDIQEEIKARHLFAKLDIREDTFVISCGAWSELYIEADFTGMILKLSYESDFNNEVSQGDANYIITHWISLK